MKTIRFVLLLMLLVLGHGWMTLSLVSSENPLAVLVNDEPILSGAHPLHQYHGYLGGRALAESGKSCCYDTHFQAGYPKTPVFDSGSRTAELCFFLLGGSYSSQAYKICLVVLWFLVPFGFLLASMGTGLRKETCLLAVFLGLLVAWGAPGKLVFENGECDALFVGLATLVQAGLLLQFDRAPGFFNGVGLYLIGILGWFLQPLLFLLLVPLWLAYYLRAGVRHRSWPWHLVFFSSQLAGLVVNLPWLYGWITHWWIYSPLPPSNELLKHRTIRTVWEAPLWGTTFDQGLAMTLLGLACLGVLFFRYSKQKIAARTFTLATAGLLTLSILGISWEPVSQMGTSSLLTPALWFACIPAANALVVLWNWGRSVLAFTWLRIVAFVGLLILLGFSAPHIEESIVEQGYRPAPLTIGFSGEQKHIIETLKEHTNTDARILWEDCPGDKKTSRWPALLPLWTGQNFVGGLDPDGRIEHSHIGFVRYLLAGRPLSHWSNEELQEYCRCYNIGWAVLWSPSSIKRFRQWKDGAQQVATFSDNGKEGILFKILRDDLSYVLHGQAHLETTNPGILAFSNIVPKGGKVVLSFHYQTGLQVVPQRVKLERETNPNDAIPLIRLAVDEPVSHLTIAWE